ncbi:hypothetical protein [Microbacterium testaceum]|nr:hypothetical protein [Microbacterium testaceum]
MPIPDPAAQDTDREDTSIVPDMEADPAEAEEHRGDAPGEPTHDPR